MALRRDHAMAPLAHRQRDQLGVLVERLGGDADIRLAGQHPLGDLGRAALVHLQPHSRVLCDKIAHHDGQGITRLGVGRGQHQAPAPAGGKLGAGAFQVLRLAQPDGDAVADAVVGDVQLRDLQRLTRQVDRRGSARARLDKGDGVFSQREVRPGEKRWYKKDKRDTFQFQIVVRLISNVDGQTVLTLQNEYPVRTYTADSGSLRPANLDQFRAQVLAQMAKDIEKALKEAREP